MTGDSGGEFGGFADAIDALGRPLLGALAALESVRRRLHPPAIPALREAVRPLAADLAAALPRFREAPAPDTLAPFAEQMAASAALALQAARGFSEDAAPTEVVPLLLRAMRDHASAQESLFPLRCALAPFNRYFAEKAFHADLDALDPEPPPGVSVGLHDAGNALDARGGFTLYVPESYDGRSPWPLVVALHGGGGHGREFLWSFLREARGRRFLLLAATSRGSTWSFQGPDVDAPALRSMVAYVSERWSVDPERILLTGLSDGATYTLLAGLQPETPFTALAPVSGVLHPANAALGNLERARGRRIYLVHGALDWMFPVDLARRARDELCGAGAKLVYREIADLSHTYPREENDGMLTWFDPGLAVDAPGA